MNLNMSKKKTATMTSAALTGMMVGAAVGEKHDEAEEAQAGKVGVKGDRRRWRDDAEHLVLPEIKINAMPRHRIYFYQSKTEVFDCCNVDYTPLRTFGSL